MLAAEETEALVELEMTRLLHAALLSSSASLVGDSHAHVWRLPKETLRRTRQPDVGADLSCHAPATVWKRLPRQPDGTARLLTLSEFGVQREAVFADARALALAIGEGMGARAAACVADVRVKEDGTLLLTTQLHMRRQRMLGRLHCAACGQFFSGDRGLRDHQQVKHGRSYGGAKAAVASARGALVAYAPPGGAAAELAALWLRRAAAKEEQRRALPEGLAAARDGRLRALRRLVGEGRFDAHATVDRHGSSALHFAAGGGHVEVCAYLVDELGVTLTQAQQADGRTALHWAARNGHQPMCAWLVARGADANAGTRDGTVPLHWAIWQAHLHVAAWLVDEAAADLHATNSYGCNAIQWAAQAEELTACAWLHRRGLDLKLLNRNGHSALHKAAVKGRRAVCEWLLSPEVGLGVEQLQPDGDGNTPSRMARLEEHTELADFLLRAEREASGGMVACESSDAEQ